MFSKLTTFFSDFKTGVTAFFIALFTFSPAAFANTGITLNLDTAPILSVITSGVTAITALGTAVLSMYVVVRMFRWVRTAMN